MELVWKGHLINALFHCSSPVHQRPCRRTTAGGSRLRPVAPQRISFPLSVMMGLYGVISYAQDDSCDYSSMHRPQDKTVANC